MASKKSKKSKNKDKSKKIIIGVVVAVVVLVVLAKYFLPGGVVAATVNGEKIYKEDVLKEYLKVPVEMRQVVTADSILEGMIIETLVLQEAEKMGISVSNAEVEDYVDELLEAYGTTEAELVENLEENGATLSEFKYSVKKKIIINQVLEQTAFAGLEVTDAELEQYYVDNMDQFKIPEYVQASHILVNTSRDAGSIRGKVLSGVDFAELAGKHSTCPSSANGGDLGWFARGQMVKPFEDAAFALDVGEISGVIETQFGFHVIKLTNRSAESTRTFDEVKPELSQQLLGQKQNDAINTYTGKLEMDADIQVFMGIEAVESDYTVDLEQIEVTQAGNDEPEVQPSAGTLAECLSAKGVEMYGSDSSSACSSQKELLGADFAGIDYVDCDADVDACDEAGISSYPTWVIDGKKHVGKYSSERLAELANC